MTETQLIPCLEEFLAAPTEAIARIAPTTVIYAPGGTRRQAALAGVAPDSEEYAHRFRHSMIDCANLLFQHGVRHQIMTTLRPAQLQERGRYRERLMDWMDKGLAGPQSLADYARLGWRVRIIGAEELPDLGPAVARLHAATPTKWVHTLWYYVTGHVETAWRAVLGACLRSGARTQSEAIRALYGEDIPLATLILSFGKPLVAPDILPPLLVGEAQCYWDQRPGYSLDAERLRRILYDYAYLRRTWCVDKTTRYGGIIEQQALWNNGSVLGIGTRCGGFWYPQSSHQPFEEEG